MSIPKIVIRSEDKPILVEKYLANNSPTMLAEEFGYNRGTIKEFLKRSGVLRSQSESSKIVCALGRKDKSIAIILARCKDPDVRFHPRKVRRGPENGNWIADRSKLKAKRFISEEKWFTKKILHDRNYLCELTNCGGVLSVHHIDGVWSHPDKIFDELNVVVIKREIHKYFHKLYTTKATRSQWEQFVGRREYESVSQL